LTDNLVKGIVELNKRTSRQSSNDSNNTAKLSYT